MSVVLKVPIETAMILKQRFERLTQLHKEEVFETERKLRSVAARTNAGTHVQRLQELQERGRRLTLPNLIRAFLQAGIKTLSDDESMLAQIAQSTVTVGRPRGA